MCVCVCVWGDGICCFNAGVTLYCEKSFEVKMTIERISGQVQDYHRRNLSAF